MPELPEVETVARILRGRIVGETIADVQVNWERTIEGWEVSAFRETLRGRTITGIGRRGKYILIEVPPQWLIVHLRMTGRLCDCSVRDDPLLSDKHVHVSLRFASGRVLYFWDLRKFGRFWLVDNPQAVVGDLGPEPLDEGFSAAEFVRLLMARRRQLKPALLDQRFLAGLGNIYVDEALWQAQLHPLRRTHTLTQGEAARLYTSIRRVLRDALAHDGTTLRDYRTPCNEPGQHQYMLAVYGRQGEPCPRCGGSIERIVVGQRGTHYCPRCQPGDEAPAA
jgi:formamidopyrimidine-DNA glycosylase